MKAQELFNEEVKAIISKRNTHDRLRRFLSKDNEVAQLVRSKIDFDAIRREEYKEDAILTVYVNANFHGKKCIVHDKWTKGTEGIIEHSLTRMYHDYYTDSERETRNEVSFRREYENEAYDAPETLAFWINTGNRQTTHLYTANNIELID